MLVDGNDRVFLLGLLAVIFADNSTEPESLYKGSIPELVCSAGVWLTLLRPNPVTPVSQEAAAAVG